ncbi:MAG: hypothetical protein FJ211_07010 [Ignavibacteria bacterium]|nr:hypothetical protein [Ignavibacteria bacterium]
MTWYRFSVAAFTALLFMATACTTIRFPEQVRTPQTQLQTREYQTREFDTNDVKLVMKAMLNVLQDDGFVVKNAVMDLGLLTATKEIQLSDKSASTRYWTDALDVVFDTRGSSSRNRTTQDTRYNKFKQVEVSVNVSELGRRCKVRANFQAKILDNTGNPVEVSAVSDPKYYQDFFSKVDKGIFLQRQGF